MVTGRRSVLSSILIALAGPRFLFAWQQGQDQIPDDPQFPGSGGSRTPGDNSPILRPDPKVQLKENQKKLRHDVDQLLQLAQELKDQAYKTEQTEVLSVPLIHKAEEIEKLARQVGTLARSA